MAAAAPSAKNRSTSGASSSAYHRPKPGEAIENGLFFSNIPRTWSRVDFETWMVKCLGGGKRIRLRSVKFSMEKGRNLGHASVILSSGWNESVDKALARGTFRNPAIRVQRLHFLDGFFGGTLLLRGCYNMAEADVDLEISDDYSTSKKMWTKEEIVGGVESACGFKNGQDFIVLPMVRGQWQVRFATGMEKSAVDRCCVNIREGFSALQTGGKRSVQKLPQMTADERKACQVFMNKWWEPIGFEGSLTSRFVCDTLNGQLGEELVLGAHIYRTRPSNKNSMVRVIPKSRGLVRLLVKNSGSVQVVVEAAQRGSLHHPWTNMSLEAWIPKENVNPQGVQPQQQQKHVPNPPPVSVKSGGGGHTSQSARAVTTASGQTLSSSRPRSVVRNSGPQVPGQTYASVVRGNTPPKSSQGKMASTSGAEQQPKSRANSANFQQTTVQSRDTTLLAEIRQLKSLVQSMQAERQTLLTLLNSLIPLIGSQAGQTEFRSALQQISGSPNINLNNYNSNSNNNSTVSSSIVVHRVPLSNKRRALRAHSPASETSGCGRYSPATNLAEKEKDEDMRSSDVSPQPSDNDV